MRSSDIADTDTEDVVETWEIRGNSTSIVITRLDLYYLCNVIFVLLV